MSNRTTLDAVKNRFELEFGNTPQKMVWSPGRVNLIGEHTDYNLGFVMPAATDRGIGMAISPSSGAVKFIALDLEESIEISTFEGITPHDTAWSNYLLGVVSEFQKRGIDVPNLQLVFSGNIPIGSGMSSSAALENAIAFTINEFCEAGFDRIELAKISQAAEHNFVGTKCGIMDQFSSLMGIENKVLKLDCRSLDFQSFPLDLGEYELLLINSKVSHNLATSEYNVRRAQCEEGVALIAESHTEVSSLRDVTMEMLDAHESLLDEVVYRRCKYVIEENARVEAFGTALDSHDLARAGDILYTAHEAMRTGYEITCPEVDFLVDYTKDHDEVLGARMMGGGFGGCTINIIKKSAVSSLISEILEAYKDKFDLEAEVYEVTIGDGVKAVS